MIRPKWLFAHATARCLSSSARPGGAAPRTRNDATGSRQRLGAMAGNLPRARNPKDDTTVMISGLSPSLRVSDFNRIAVQGLADWNSAIEQASQDRDPWTLEPLGKWRITFGTPSAALSFKDKLNRLHTLSALKMNSPNGLWESSVPTHLQGPELKEEVDAFTVAPGSLPRIKISRNGRNGQWGWERHARMIIARTARFTASKTIVLVALQRPCFTAGELEDTMKRRDEARNFAWKVSSPYHLFDSLDDQYMKLDASVERVALRENSDFMTKVKSRFVMVCADDEEAWRFIKRWNQCLIEGESGETGRFERTMINVSLIELQQT